LVGSKLPAHPCNRGEGSKEDPVQYRGGFGYSALADTARELRQKETKAEVIVWRLLRNRNFMGQKFRRQHQIGLYIVDFYCDELKLIVELDGSIHLSKGQKEKDIVRDEYLKSAGFIIFRFKNHEVLNKPENFLKTIENLFLIPSPSGRGLG